MIRRVAPWPTVSPKLPLILLPPSEGKSPGGDGPAWRSGTMAVDLDEERSRVIHALGSALQDDPAARSKLLGVKSAALEAATQAGLTVRTAPTMRAIERYSGVLYGALDPSSLSTGQRRRLDAGVLIVSGLWGLVAPGDRIPDYKLKMGATLPSLGRLSTWWRPSVSAALADRSVGRVVWNLLPKEHDAAWARDGLRCRAVYTVRFLERRADGSLTAVAHWNKFLKGALVRFLLEDPTADPGRLERWRHPSGYVFDPSRTEEADGATVLSFVQGSSDGR
jgi:uncharacterized protein